ncbi:MAG: PKD domain-containing protein, partial [Bacteroidales bacterium]
SVDGDTIWNNRSITIDTLTQTTDFVLTVRDTRGCTTSKEFTIFVYPELNIASCYTDEDTVCAGEPVKLYTEVTGGNGGPYQIYLNGDDVIPSPYTFYPSESGYYNVRVTDMCSTPAVKDSVYIHVWPLPRNNFIADVVEGCPPLKVNFTEITADDGSEFEWSFGDQQFSFGQNVTHVFKQSGYHTVALKLTDEHGCEKVREKVNMIRVFPQPKVDFYTEPDEISILNPIVDFYATTENTDSLYWYFGDGDTTHQNINYTSHTYDGKGEYIITLVGESEYNCRDTSSKKIKINESYSFYAPTAFSPNRDGYNDCFSVCGHGIDQNDFVLRIYDRWGELVFETTEYDDSEGCDACNDGAWDGTYQGNIMKGDRVLEQGIYGWVCTFKDKSGIVNEYSGQVRLIR